MTRIVGDVPWSASRNCPDGPRLRACCKCDPPPDATTL